MCIRDRRKGTYTYYRCSDHADPDIAHQYVVLTMNAARLTDTHYAYTCLLYTSPPPDCREEYFW